MAKLLCYLFGCDPDKDDSWVCRRCHGYYLEFEPGLWFRFTHRLETDWAPVLGLWPFKRCAECGKFVFSFEPYPLFCSQDCHDDWVPF